MAILPGQEYATFEALEDIRSLDERTPGLSLNLGFALNDLGRHKDAIHTFAEAADRYAESSPHYYAQCLLGETIALLHARMPERAADRMLEFAHILPFVDSAQIRRDVKGMLDASAAWGRVQGMRDARDQLRAVIASE